MLKYNYLIKLSLALIDKPVGTNKHFTYIFYKTRLVSIGFNNYFKTHPLAKEVSQSEHKVSIHSELDAIKRAERVIGRKALTKCILVNVRVNTRNQVLLSKPCKQCCKILQIYGISKVYYSTAEKKFLKWTK